VHEGIEVPKSFKNLYFALEIIAFILIVAGILVFQWMSNRTSYSHIDSLCAEDIAVSGNLLYIADGPGGVKVVDIADPNHPDVLKTIESTYAIRIYIHGGCLFLCDGPGGLKVYSIDTPADPQLVFSDRTEWAKSAAFTTDHLYLADFNGTCRIYDIADPELPSLVNSTMGSQWARDIAFSGSSLYVCNQIRGLAVYTITNPERPTRIFEEQNISYKYSSVSATDKYAMIAQSDEFTKIRIFDIADPSLPRLITEVVPARFIESLINDGNILLVCCGEEGVISYNLLSLPNIEKMDQFDTPGYARMARIIEGRLFVADMSGVCIYSNFLR
jgi:hypothetical protein